MPRAARIDIPNLLHHVIVRGIEKRDIFTGDDDRRDFVRRFSALLESTATECLAWALLSNHVHLLLRPKEITLSKFMRRLLTGYAVAFNLRHGRCGHLFQNRYKSIVCNEEEYLLELIRYIHLNPLRAGVVATLDELDRYPWCGHSVLLANNEMPGQETTEVLSRFGKSGTVARRRYRAFVQDGLHRGHRDELVGTAKPAPGQDRYELRDSRVLGDGEFVEQILRRAEMELPAETISLDRIIKAVLTELDVPQAELMSRTRALRVANARGIICHLAYSSGHRGVDIAARLNISGAGVTVAAGRGRVIIQDHPGLLAVVSQKG